MSAVKDAVIRLVQSMPDDCTVEDIQHHLYVQEKVLRGSRAIDEGRVRTEGEVQDRLDQWAASYGLTRQSKT